MTKDHLLHDQAVIAKFMNREDFEDEPEHLRHKLSHDEKLIRDFCDWTGDFAE